MQKACLHLPADTDTAILLITWQLLNFNAEADGHRATSPSVLKGITRRE